MSASLGPILEAFKYLRCQKDLKTGTHASSNTDRRRDFQCPLQVQKWNFTAAGDGAGCPVELRLQTILNLSKTAARLADSLHASPAHSLGLSTFSSAWTQVIKGDNRNIWGSLLILYSRHSHCLNVELRSTEYFLQGGIFYHWLFRIAGSWWQYKRPDLVIY